MQWDGAANPPVNVAAAGPATGAAGFSSSAAYISTSDTSASVAIQLNANDTADNGILNSLRVGSSQGQATVTLTSSNPANPVVTVTVPTSPRTQIVQTDWTQPEQGRVTITVDNPSGAQNVLLDDVTFTTIVPAGGP